MKKLFSIIRRFLHCRERSKLIKMGCSFDETNNFGPGSEIKLSKFGAYTSVNARTKINQALVGNYCQIASDVFIGPRSHIFTNFTVSDEIYKYTKEHYYAHGVWEDQFLVKIGHDVWVGYNATILSGVEIGNGAIVATGSVVTKSVPAYAIVGGNPARIIKYRFDDVSIGKLEESAWFDLDVSSLIEKKDELEALVGHSTSDFIKQHVQAQKVFMQLR